MYACGGFTGKKKGSTNTVERYSFESKKWEVISSMNEKRCAPAVIVFEDRIYAIGGTIETLSDSKTKSKEVYLDTVCETMCALIFRRKFIEV